MKLLTPLKTNHPPHLGASCFLRWPHSQSVVSPTAALTFSERRCSVYGMCLSLNMPAFPCRAALPARWYPSQVSCISESPPCPELRLPQNSFCVETQTLSLIESWGPGVWVQLRDCGQVIWSMSVRESQDEVCGFNYIPEGAANSDGDQNVTRWRPYPWGLGVLKCDPSLECTLLVPPPCNANFLGQTHPSPEELNGSGAGY